MLSEAQGIPLAVAVSGANMHDSLALKPLIRGAGCRPDVSIATAVIGRKTAGYSSRACGGT
ncbi:hypothetical protein ACFYXM_24600 [Streptomyces sp. NPDC002476]|uniref:hypothetical protein n=1 Tax=Streptomyces sp. NPDC002476 TaxID=3364648 RepID=UPI0036C8D71A